jgi:poly(3-hydroxybutyrate) depolymerase
MVSISGTASDNVMVAKVEVSIDGGAYVLATGTTSWTYPWQTTAVANGSHSISARATDSSGHTAAATATVTVNNASTVDMTPPTVSIAAPAASATVAGSTTIHGSASDNVGVTAVTVQIDSGAMQPAVGTSSWSYAWDTTAASNASHTIVVRASDAAGNTGMATVMVTVSNTPIDTVPPTISIAMPTNGSTVAGTTSIAGSASDNVGVTAVAVAIDGGSYMAATGTSSWSYAWTTSTVANGSHSITARASDAAGHTATATVTVMVANSTTCSNDCALGQSTCASTTGWQVCGQYDSDSCLDWSPVQACPTGTACSAGECKPTCTNTCAVAGLKRCNGMTTEVCGDANHDGCLEWDATATCSTSCSLGTCGGATCSNQCQDQYAQRCDPASGGYQLCYDSNGDGCMEWVTYACGSGTTCAKGSCYTNPPPNECSSGQTRCDPEGGGVETCAASSTGQLKWTAPTACAAGDTCTWGACRGGCTDDCIEGQSRCDSAGHLQRCGQYDADGCLEWPTTASTESCATGESCVNGTCISNTATGYHAFPFYWGGESLPYDLYVPASYPSGTTAVGLLVALHGSCEAGTREATSAGGWDVAAESLGILAVAAHGPLPISSTAGLTAPVPTAHCWEIGTQSGLDSQADYLQRLEADIASRSRIDPSRVEAFGFSGGAYVACHLAMFYSAIFKGAAMNSGECNWENTDPTYISQRIPFYFIAGSVDPLTSEYVVPEYDFLSTNGYKTTMVTISGAGHTYFPSYAITMWNWLITP